LASVVLPELLELLAVEPLADEVELIVIIVG
jgi:hypothetical protein